MDIYVSLLDKAVRKINTMKINSLLIFLENL